jgi:hypothetical protein
LKSRSRSVTYVTSVTGLHFRFHFRYTFAPFARRAVTGRVSLCCSRGACVGGVGAGSVAGVSRWCEVRVRVCGGCARATQIASASEGSSSRTAADRVCGMSLSRAAAGRAAFASHVAGELRERGDASRVAGWWWWSATRSESGASRERVGSESGASRERVGSESGASRVRHAAAAFAAFAEGRVRGSSGASRLRGLAVEYGPLSRVESWALASALGA